MRRARLDRIFATLVMAAVLALPAAASAQKRGRTDGPPGSHIGAGGYQPAGFHRYSLELEFGASVSERPSRDDGVPISLGGVFSFWGDDWIRVDLSAHYLMNNGRFLLLAGPRFQTGFWPVSLFAGLKAGPMWIEGGTPYFALSPQVGADMLLGDRVMLGLGWAIDFPFGELPGDEPRLSQRPHMSVGVRF